MKKLTPLAIIAIFAALSFASCKKTSTSSTCTCTYKGSSTGTDTTIKYTVPPAGYTSIGTYCNYWQTVYQGIDPAASCHL